VMGEVVFLHFFHVGWERRVVQPGRKNDKGCISCVMLEPTRSACNHIQRLL
jgi:hypothetical protein